MQAAGESVPDILVSAVENPVTATVLPVSRPVFSGYLSLPSPIKNV